MTSLPATRPIWRFPSDHRFTTGERRSVIDAVGSYAYQWGLRPVSPFHDVQSARRSRHTESGFDGWQLLYAELLPVRRLLKDLQREKGGHFLTTWLTLRAAGFRPIVESQDARWSFQVGTVPLDFLYEVEPLPTRRGIATISRWSWCRGCDSELAATRAGWCAWCAVAPVALSADDVRPVGAPLGYVPEATL
jgi:hypothetical protein